LSTIEILIEGTLDVKQNQQQPPNSHLFALPPDGVARDRGSSCIARKLVNATAHACGPAVLISLT
jgi:hypothetical protein